MSNNETLPDQKTPILLQVNVINGGAAEPLKNVKASPAGTGKNSGGQKQVKKETGTKNSATSAAKKNVKKEVLSTDKETENQSTPASANKNKSTKEANIPDKNDKKQPAKKNDTATKYPATTTTTTNENEASKSNNELKKRPSSSKKVTAKTAEPKFNYVSKDLCDSYFKQWENHNDNHKRFLQDYIKAAFTEVEWYLSIDLSDQLKISEAKKVLTNYFGYDDGSALTIFSSVWRPQQGKTRQKLYDECRTRDPPLICAQPSLGHKFYYKINEKNGNYDPFVDPDYKKKMPCDYKDKYGIPKAYADANWIVIAEIPNGKEPQIKKVDAKFGTSWVM